MSRVTRCGAFAPCTSTAPITRSAPSIASSTACRFEIESVMRPPSIESSSRIRSTERSSTHTSACMPTAISAAL